MSKYKIYFEIYKKKMVAEIDADSEYNAKEQIMDKIIFHKIECTKFEPKEKSNLDFNNNEMFDSLKNIFGFK